MSKQSIQQFSTTAASNTDIAGINVNTGWPPSNVGIAFRTLMSFLADSLIPQSVAMTTGSLTLTASEASAEFLTLTGSPGGTCTVTLPANGMSGYLWNKSDDGSAVVLTTGSGRTVPIASGITSLYVCDGTNVDTVTYNFGSLAISGLLTAGTLATGKIETTGSLLVVATTAGAAGVLTVDNASTVAGSAAAFDLTTGTAGSTATAELIENGSGASIFSLNLGTAVASGTIAVGASAPLVVQQGTTTPFSINAGGTVVAGAASITALNSGTVVANTVTAAVLSGITALAVTGNISGAAATLGGQMPQWQQLAMGNISDYQDVTASRATGTAYVNGAVRPVWQKVQFNLGVSSSATLHVNGNVIDKFETGGSGMNPTLDAWLLPGQTIIASGGGSASMTKWWIL